ncbi:type ISP restriction/modification enzyme [Beggiatoa leptomitoformis]|uniref:site-specific DNA-methyltransferase (adenine-specific) n=1 Tax=Beggiatoa leptomitoformis TaxID=288004 RepID=A0A2N9YIU7_9GAMM|nr:type ISP restriction/modification enzyme [Beggiatoa leptomitoformis]ALG67503.1 N-6 DNA methylase [Beggiatoa leptomitoformis]AUI70275.1 N-6 DNA methylase [Beggiatoa leptomitoformis]
MTTSIQSYYRELDDLRRIGGGVNEGNLRRAFENLLKEIAEEHQLIVLAEYPIKKTTGNLRVDGAVIDRLRLVHGWWEAKDEKDDLDTEISLKLAKGYPSDNIIFEDTRTAVLYQHHEEAFRTPIENAKQFEKLLTRFFDYELPQVQNFRLARDKFLSELPDVSKALIQLLEKAHTDNLKFHQQAQQFLALCQRSIGQNVTRNHVDEMLIQHILTDQVFRAVFPDSNFHRENHLAVAIGELERSFFLGETRINLLKRLEPYFAAIRQAAASTVTSHEKQTFLKQVYEDFYTAYNPKDADKLGIVYTPQEAVRFIISGCDWLAQEHFNKSLIDKDLDILDPCTGTGTFIVDLLDFWRGQNKELVRKFMQEVHANEVSILSYYIACLNIEQTFYEITHEWQEFKGLCLVNTLDNVGFEQTHSGAISDIFGSLTDENHLRIQAQNKRKIPIILGNPPYNANQQNENDNNKNDVAIAIDKRIKDTYLSESTAQKTKLYDPYVRFFRWASDRLGEKGILGFVTNRSYLDSRSFDGFRKTIAKEFQEVWIVDLMSDVRKNPKISGTKHNIFGIQAGVAIVFLVRNPALNGCKIHHLALDDFLPAIEKRRWLKSHSLQKLAKTGQFDLIRPNPQGLWLNQPTEDWADYLPIASKEAKAGRSQEAIFKLHSLGVVTNRDEWVYDFSEKEVNQKVNFLIDNYEQKRLNSELIDTEIKWTRAVKNDLAKNVAYSYDEKCVIDSVYRPFIIKKLYFNQKLNEMQYKLRDIFGVYPNSNFENVVICFSNVTTNKQFFMIATNVIPDLHLTGDTVAIALYTYAKDNTRQDNITDWALTQFREHYQTTEIEKTDIFHYVYAVLHNPAYREKFALNLKQEFPRIPFYNDFFKWKNWGARLIQLHVNFETITPYAFTRVDSETKTNKVRLKADKTSHLIEIDSETQLKNIPEIAWQYQLGNRSALEWVLDQYKEKTPKDPTIREKFNNYHFADYKETVIDLLGKVCTVSVETMGIVGEML